MTFKPDGVQEKGGGRQRTLEVIRPVPYDRLRADAVGLTGVLLLTVTGAAPLTSMMLCVPVVVGFGQGAAAPATFLFATLVLLVFSVGYAAMCRKVSATGGFYTFISHGLGRELGLATGFGLIVAYSVFEASLEGAFAYFACEMLRGYGFNLPWPVPALAMAAGIAVLAYFDVRISAGVLGAALLVEIIALIIFDAGVIAQASGDLRFDTAIFSPLLALKGFEPPAPGMAAGAAGVGLFFAFGSWAGFEMAPNYAEESKDPRRIIPLALYISVLMLGVVYVVTCWLALAAQGTIEQAIITGQRDASNFFLRPAENLVGHWLAVLMSLIVLTSCFSCGLAFHNTAARYLYALGREGILPMALGRTHTRHMSPHIASLIQSAAAVMIILIFAAALGAGDPHEQAYAGLYVLMGTLATLLILAAQALVSLAVILYFRREHPGDVHWWRTLGAPVLAFGAQFLVIFTLIENRGFIGGGSSFADYIAPIAFGVLLAGVLTAHCLKKTRPQTYALIGHEALKMNPVNVF